MRRRVFAFLAFATLMPIGAGVRGQEPTPPPGPRINPLRIETRGPDIFIRFTLLGALNPDLARRIEAGLETAILYDIRLLRRYPYWFDTFVDSRRYRVSVTYDPVTREYVVAETMDGKPLRRTTTRDFAQAANRLLSQESLLVFRVRPNDPQRNLYVWARATFDSGYLFTIIPVSLRTPWKKSQRFNMRKNPAGPVSP